MWARVTRPPHRDTSQVSPKSVTPLVGFQQHQRHLQTCEKPSSQPQSDPWTGSPWFGGAVWVVRTLRCSRSHAVTVLQGHLAGGLRLQMDLRDW